jgi:hypothetical protein
MEIELLFPEFQLWSVPGGIQRNGSNGIGHRENCLNTIINTIMREARQKFV